MQNENNAVEVFTNNEFGEVRTVMINEEPWFVGKDVAIALGYANARDAIATHVDDEDRVQGDGVAIRDSIGREQHPVVINESGVYALVFGSKLDSAKRFKHWITSEVLPSLRKHGAYMTPQTLHECLQDPRAMANILNALADEQDKNRKLTAIIEDQKPKVEFADYIAASENAIEMGDFSKLAQKNGITLGRNNLFKKLRELGILMSDNVPYQQYMNAGWFEVVEQPYQRNGTVYIGTKTLVTGKGQIALVRKLRKVLSEDSTCYIA